MLVFSVLEIITLLVGTIMLFISCASLFGESFDKQNYGDFDSFNSYSLLFLSIGLGFLGFYLGWTFLIFIKMVQIIIDASTLKKEESLPKPEDQILTYSQTDLNHQKENSN